MKSEKKAMLIWVLAIMVIVLTIVLGVVIYKNKNTKEVGADVAVKATEAPKPSESPSPEEGPVSQGQENMVVDATKEIQPQTTKVPESSQTTVTKEEVITANKEPVIEAPEEKATPKPAEAGKLSALYLEGTQLCNENGPIQLRGISTHGLAWFPKYVNEDCFKDLKEDWNANVVRLAMYTAENGGYCTDGNKEDLKKLVKNGVEYATNAGLYVIIDWHILHDLNPNVYKEEAKKFFKEMSEEYKDYTNVIYEICNEPNGGTGWKEIKSYAEEVIEVIRKNDEDAIIIVGTPNWSQYVDQAAADPITSSENIMYALHFYAATHKDDLRSKMKNAVNNGLPIFVSEYGICDASGNGSIDEAQANTWVDAMDDLGISYVAWSLCNKNESASMIKSSCNKTSGFTKEDLSTGGKWLYEMLTGRTVDDFTPSNTDDKDNQGSNPNGQQGSQGNKENQNTPAPTKAPIANVSTDSGLRVQAQLQDSWSDEEGTSSNYSLTLTNNSAKAVDGWEIVLQFTGNISAVQGWGGNFSMSGNTLRITNVDYNRSIGAGESKQDIGFIVTGDDSLMIKE